MTTYFEILIVNLHVLYVFKTYVKFHTNRMRFTIQSINLLYIYIYIYIILNYKNLKYNNLIDDIAIDF